MFTFGELMEDLREEEYRRRIMFAEFSLYGTKILLCDSADFSASYYKKGNNVMLALAISDKAEMERIFHRLAEEGTVLFGPTPTEVIEELGIVTDKFGVTWQINLSPKGPKVTD